MNLRRSNLAALAVATVFGLAGMAATAQPAGGPAHMYAQPGGMEIEHMLVGLKSQLNLNTSQQLSWDSAVAQSKAAHDAARASRQKFHDVMTAELAKPEPDLAQVAAVADSVHAANQSVHQGVRNQWLQVYATFSPEQKGIVRDALSKQLARMETFGAKMREHMQRGG